jgi:hypothetical protein
MSQKLIGFLQEGLGEAGYFASYTDGDTLPSC